MKKRLFLLALVASLLLWSGCASQTADPLLKNEATDAPGLSMNLPPASAGTADAGTVNVSLYYRYLDEPMYTAVTGVLSIAAVLSLL